MRRPEVELSDCIKCGICQEVCPEVFELTDTGYVQVIVLSQYPAECVDEAAKHCPAHCIYWEFEDSTGDGS